MPQQAWILNDTVKNNVLYGASYNKKDYHKVIDICALRPDLEILPGADETEIGEKVSVYDIRIDIITRMITMQTILSDT